jgi:hypothetical protein
MTSPSPRKPRTTVQSTRAKKTSAEVAVAARAARTGARPCNAALRCGVLLVVLAAAAVLASAADRVARQAAYTTGASGGKLKWLPPEADAVSAVADESSAQSAAVRPVQHTDAEVKSESVPLGKPARIGKPSLTDRVLESKNGELKNGDAKTGDAKTSRAKADDVPAGKDTPDITVVKSENVEDCVKLDTLKPINRNILDDIAPKPGKLPINCPMQRVGPQRRDWAETTFCWTASGLCAKPAYFTDVHLERYGHTWSPLFQPLVSAGHFFLSVPALPYAIGLYPPNECVYTLGYYRAGSCAPHYLDPFPISVRAAMMEAGAAVGLVYLIP